MAVFTHLLHRGRSFLDGLICSYSVKSWKRVAVQLDEVVAGELDSQFCGTTTFQMSVKSKTAPIKSHGLEAGDNRIPVAKQAVLLALRATRVTQPTISAASDVQTKSE
jgi:hypothetical protein